MSTKAGLGIALAAMLATASGNAASTVVVVDIAAPTLDGDRLRAAVGTELSMAAVEPDDPRARDAMGRVTIEARNKTLTVSFRKAGGGSPVTRTMPLSDQPRRAESSAVILAANVARDEAGDLLDGLKAKVGPNPPPPPAPAQWSALERMAEATAAYERGARQYRDTVTSIIRLHYEAKRKDVLAGLDRELAIEKAELTKARAVAIQRLETFVAAHRDAPDAMYRLAALYEERSRASEKTLDLSDAIALYERLIREHPNYREIGGVHYFLGHALNDVGRVAEAQQAWRALVCRNHFEYPTKKPLPQDANEAYWTAWRRRYASPGAISKSNPETVYVEAYPADCQSNAQPKYTAEAWWQIGNWEFDQLDFAAGVWSYNRAASAYSHGMESKQAPLFGVTLYKYAWTLYKQQRYSLATKAFVKLLLYTDEQEKLTGGSAGSTPTGGGADFRSEAYTYIAGSLTNVDFEGPEAWEPYVQRPDILDTEPNPDKAEAKLRVAIDRVMDPTLVPQDRPWTIEIYRALGAEYRGLNQFGNAITVYDTILRRWPMSSTAPEIQAAIAETYEQAAMTKRTGTPEHDAIARKALEARTKLANYVGTTPWVDANKDDPAALRRAERLVRGALQRAAAQHTNNGKAALTAAASAPRARQIELLARAAAEYELAAVGWQAFLKQDENAPDAYDSRYWLADARRNLVGIQMKLHEAKGDPEPSKQAIAEAMATAADVRDSNEDDKYIDNAAFFVVELADVARDLAYARGEMPKRDEVKFDGPDPATRNVVRDPIPPVLQASLLARDEYLRAVPPNRDPQRRGLAYAYYVAETYFLHGQWEEARARFEPMWKEQCGASPYGFKAWEKLLTMATLRRDEAGSLALAAAVDPRRGGRSCDPASEGPYTGRIESDVLVAKAWRKFREVEKQGGKEQWREVAALCERALEAGASGSQGYECNLLAANASGRAGDYNKAIKLYERFLREHGATDTPDHTKDLGGAYEMLGTMYVSLFDYAKAADTFARTAEHEHLDEATRRTAAKNAVILYAQSGQRNEMFAAQKTLMRLHPSAEESADAAFRVASAEGTLEAFYQANRTSPAATKRLVEAAYTIAKAKRTRAWFAETVAAWERLRTQDRVEAQKAPYVDCAAEAAFTMIEEDIAAKFDVPTKHAYGARSFDILGDPTTGTKGKYALNAADAKRWVLALQTDVIEKYTSLTWVPTAIARQGAIYDTLRSGLYDATKVNVLSAPAEKLAATLRKSGQDAKADGLEDAARDFWRERKERELDAADALMIDRYATAAAYARKHNVTTPALTHALTRLAYFTELLGDVKLQTYVTATADPITKGAKLSYTPGLYARTRPGLTSPPPARGNASAMPSIP